MFNHILVPLDGSPLAECVLPHVKAIAPVTNARVTLIHVLDHVEDRNGNSPIDPLSWHMHKQELQVYLEQTTADLQKQGLNVNPTLIEGKSAESIIEFAHTNEVDLIALSTHGRTGLTGWNVSSVVQKVLLRSYRSILLARAYAASPADEIHYQRLFLGMDCSARAEFILPVAIGVAQHHHSRLIIASVIEKPHTVHRLPISDEDAKLIDQLTDRNQNVCAHYLEQITTQLSLKGLDVETKIVVADQAIGALHDMVNESRADLVMLVAHGHSGERRWPYGSIAASFIAHGNVPLLIMQDLSEHEALPTHAEQAIREVVGH